MGLFSGLKRLFGNHQCPCQEARLYTQKEMDEQSKYWIEIVAKAKEQVRKECEKSLLLVRPHLQVCEESSHKREESSQVKKEKRQNGSGSILNYERDNYNRGVRRKRKRAKALKSKPKSINYITPYGKDKQLLYEEMRKATIDFLYNCCEWVDNQITSDKFMEIYSWWCKQNKRNGYESKTGVGKVLRKTGVKTAVVEKKYLKQFCYLGIKIRSDIMKQYEDYKKTQTTHAAQSGAPVVCTKEPDIFKDFPQPLKRNP